MTLKVINKINGKIKFLNRKNRYLTKEVRRMLWHALIPSHFDYVFFVFFLSKFSFIDTDDSQDNREREWLIFYSITTSTHSQTFRHLFATLHVCMWDDYHIFSITPLVFTRLLHDEIYHLIELLFDWLMMWS